MWPTDRVRVCVKELCRMNGLAYIPVTREEGLVLLASFAHISVATLSRINPIAYIKAYLDDCEGDQIELIIKMCQMLGPYTYRILAQGSIDIIKEEEEEEVKSTPSSDVVVVVAEPLSVINEDEEEEEEEIPMTVEEVKPETAVVIVVEPLTIIDQTTEQQQQQVEEVSSSCCCFSFHWPRKR